MDVKIQDVPNISGTKVSGNSETDGSVFKGFYNAAMDMVNETNDLQKEADQMSVDFALGKVDSISDLMIAQEKASIALQYTMQVRDTVLEAYNEILSMQV